MPLNYTNSIPLHVQLNKVLENRILQGKYFDKIPSERELMDEFRVSRSTVRQSISELVTKGILQKKPGRGTFVVHKPVNDWLGSLSSTSETVERMGMVSGTKLIKSEIMTLDGGMVNKTGLQKAYHFERIRFANHLPIGIERHYYPVSLGEKLIQFDLNKEAFYDLLEKELGVKGFEAAQVIKAGKPSKEDANKLHISSTGTVLNTERLITDVHGDFIELEDACYRADMYSFKVKLSRNSN